MKRTGFFGRPANSNTDAVALKTEAIKRARWVPRRTMGQGNRVTGKYVVKWAGPERQTSFYRVIPHAPDTSFAATTDQSRAARFHEREEADRVARFVSSAIGTKAKTVIA